MLGRTGVLAHARISAAAHHGASRQGCRGNQAENSCGFSEGSFFTDVVQDDFTFHRVFFRVFKVVNGLRLSREWFIYTRGQ